MLNLAHWAVGDLLAGQGLRAGFFTGAEGQRRRTQNIVEFHDDPSFRILFSSDAGGVGLNLQRAANCVINLDLPWNPAVLEQRIGRVYRLGQKKPIDVFNIVSEQGIESRISVLVNTKQAFFKGLFDGDTDTVNFGEASSFLSRIKKLIDPSAIAVVSARGGQAEAEPDRAEADADTDLDLDIDDEVTDPIDELIDATDEAADSTPAPPQDQAPPEAAADVDGRAEAGGPVLPLATRGRARDRPVGAGTRGRIRRHDSCVQAGDQRQPSTALDRRHPRSLRTAPGPTRADRQSDHRSAGRGRWRAGRALRRDGRIAPVDR